MNHLQPISGTPLIPPFFVTIYFAIFIGILLITYLFIHLKARDLHISHKLKKLAIFATVIKILVIIGVILVATYWLYPAPAPRKVMPLNNSIQVPLNNPVEIEFDRPVNRQVMEKSIFPDTPGVWVFEKPLYATHLYRKLTFYPHQSLEPGTVYKITLFNVQNTSKISDSRAYSLTFTTQNTPNVTSVIPRSDSSDIPVTSQVTINLSEGNDRVSDFEFSLNPEISFRTQLSLDKHSYLLIPLENFSQGTTYTLTIRKTDLFWNLDDDEIIHRSPTTEEYSGTFTTKEPPGIEEFAPPDTNAPVDSTIKIRFTQAMDQNSVKEGLQIAPDPGGKLLWEDDKTLIIKPTRLEYEKKYTVFLAQGIKDKEGGYLMEKVTKAFTTIGYVKPTNFSPSSGWEGVGIGNPIKVTFDQEVNKSSAQEKFSITPYISGDFSWEGNTLIFQPKDNLPFSTQVTIKIGGGIKSIYGLDSIQAFTSSFKTQSQVFKLSVPAFLQKHPLSCEVSALRMTLAYRGIQKTEEELLSKVGFDPTEHIGNVWGNPYERFVGNVDGRQMTTGYGVYWGPIARVAKEFTNSQSFEGWGVKEVTQAVIQGNPVIIWVFSRGGVPTSWYTPEGQKIYAVSGEHSVVVVGFVGPAEDPTQIIVNDPLVGQIYWTRSVFDKKWSVFNRSGVVIY